MIITNGNNTYGNTALNPQVDTSYKKYKKLNKQKNKHLKKLQYKRLINKIKIMKKIVMVFVIAMLLLLRYAYICNLRRNMTDVQTQIAKVSKQNNELTMELLKYNNLDYIEKTAAGKLNMVKSNYRNSIYCNLENNKKVNNKTKELNKEKNKIIDTLISKLF